MTKFSVDLTNCDKEPIHIPGKIQSHGFLVAVDKNSLSITYISENAGVFLAAQATSLLNKPLPVLNHFIKQQDLSTDGKNWQDIYTLENHDKGEYSYPAIIQDKSGNIHLSYTAERKKITYAEIRLVRSP